MRFDIILQHSTKAVYKNRNVIWASWMNEIKSKKKQLWKSMGEFSDHKNVVITEKQVAGVWEKILTKARSKADDVFTWWMTNGPQHMVKIIYVEVWSFLIII